MYKKTLLFAVASLLAVTSLAQKNYQMGNPKDVNYDYLKDYAPLKEYVNYEKYPNFKLGIGTTVNDYLNNSTVKGLTNDNFTETVAGNAMKMASCVDGNGNMNFTTVTRYVNAATAAGLNVYGHTLAWHAQQPVGWLNSLLKDHAPVPFEHPDTMVYVTLKDKNFCTEQKVGWTADKAQYGFSLNFDSTNGLNIHTTKIQDAWLVQFIAVDNLNVEKDKTYKVTFTIKGSKSGRLHTKFSDWGSGPGGDIAFTTAWKEVSMNYKLTVNNAFMLLQCGDFLGDIYIKDIRIEESVGAMKVAGDDRCMKISTNSGASSPSDNQFFLVSPTKWSKGYGYVFTAKVRADKDATVSTEVHTTPGETTGSTAFGDINFTTDWQTITLKGTFPIGGKAVAFNLSELKENNNYYFDNVSLKVSGVEKMKNGNFEGDDVSTYAMKTNGGDVVPAVIDGNMFVLQLPKATPLTPQEKHDTLVWAMDKWIKGMMNACGGKVKAWDVVNESISGGGNDGQGNYTLQHYNGNDGDFFWQDHMGDLEYVRSAIRLARKYGPKDIKLFINDYNLESDWDGNKKLKSLIGWIKKWEADGETHVDGIGTQMHISCYMNAGTQASKKNAITNMFKLMAESGKLVRVSELDLGMVDANGKDVPTGEMTEEMHHMMADHYEWIVKEYLRIVPPAQQWGITFWCPTDSPANSGWRANTPVGIWTLNTFYRKHAYAGIAEGLGGVVTAVDDVEADEDVAASAAPKRIVTMQGVVMPKGTKLSELPSGIYIVDGKKFKK